eukprot:353939-Chlamydomonas_euryale.AAC.13
MSRSGRHSRVLWGPDDGLGAWKKHKQAAHATGSHTPRNVCCATEHHHIMYSYAKKQAEAHRTQRCGGAIPQTVRLFERMFSQEAQRVDSLTKMPESLSSIQWLGAFKRLRCFLGPVQRGRWLSHGAWHGRLRQST